MFYDKTQALSAKNREVYTTICPVLHESGMGGEVVVLAMFEDEDAFGSENVLLEYDWPNLPEYFTLSSLKVRPPPPAAMRL